MIPVEVADQILAVVDHLMNRMAKLEEAVNSQRDADPVEVCRNALIDMTVEAKAVVVAKLNGWVEAERGTHQTLQ